MILHIIKKDVRLLWPFVAGLTALTGFAQWMQYGWSVLGSGSVFPIFAVLAVIGWIIVVAMLVHQDVIPGKRQDWLTRPIRRRDLVAAKLSFVIAFLHLPLFMMMTIAALAADYPLPNAAGAALATSIAIFVVITLPAFALAAATSSFVEMLIVGLVVAVVAETATQVFNGVTNLECGATCGSSLSWVGGLARVTVVVIAGLALVALQYFRRGSTSLARAVLLAAAVSFSLAGRVSWSTAFALQSLVTGAPAAPSSVTISLDRDGPSPSAAASPQILAARGRLSGLEPGAVIEDVVSRSIAGTTISVPLHVEGQRAGTVLWADRVEVRLLDGTGRVVFRTKGGGLEIRPGIGVAQSVLIPARVFDEHAGTDLRAELDYWFTELAEKTAATLPAEGGEVRLASGEQCSTLVSGSAVRLSCLTIHRRPPCYSAVFEGGPDLLVCAPSYWPRAASGNLFSRFELDASSANGALRVATYEPRDHFTAQLVVPQLRLGDWTVDSSASE
jgi:hypothetical protein